MTKEEYKALKVPFPIDSAARDAIYIGTEAKPKSNIELARERIKQDREFGASYYGGVL